MNLKELDSFKLGDAIKFHNELNPALFDGERLDPEVREQLMVIAQDFLDHLGVSDLEVKDITISGSNAAYTYTPHSDIDLHILVDIDKLTNDDVYRELFTAKKTVYNDTHDIKIHGYDVELYVQDSKLPVQSLGEYSVLRNRWIKFPVKRRSNFDERASAQKFAKLAQLAQRALDSNDLDTVQHVLDTIKKYRQAGLDKNGEFGPENLAYKALRSRGIVDQLFKHRDQLHAELLSLGEDYDPDSPPGPEFKPTMPAGTVRVDVSDVYDWYKLGQHISNLKGLGHHDFGQGAPSTIMAFGSEDAEHEYIDALKKTGLTTTDIDPVDPKQPKNMPRQKVDPTYNVNESGDSEIRNYRKLDKILGKLCEMVVKGQDSDRDYGMVAAAVMDPDNKIVARLNRPGKNGKRIHAERAAVSAYEQKYGAVPEGSVIITTLSPCNETDDDTATGRLGENCAQYLNDKGIKKVYCGYIDPTQDNDIREFTLIETGDTAIREECKGFADTFLKQEISEASGYIPSEKQKNDPRFKTALTVDVRPDAIKKNAKAFGWLTDRAGIPPTAKPSGKIK